MTFEEFKSKLQKRYRPSLYYYYSLSVLVVLLSFMSCYYLITQPDRFQGPLPFFYGLSGLLFLMGASGFLLLPNRYKIVEVPCSITIEYKEALIGRLFADALILENDPIEHFIKFRLSVKWWESAYTVYLYFDEIRFAFSVQGHDFDGGFLDFGGTERKRKGIKESIQALCAETS